MAAAIALRGDDALLHAATAEFAAELVAHPPRQRSLALGPPAREPWETMMLNEAVQDRLFRATALVAHCARHR
jgi:hypothetical protein